MCIRNYLAEFLILDSVRTEECNSFTIIKIMSRNKKTSLK